MEACFLRSRPGGSYVTSARILCSRVSDERGGCAGVGCGAEYIAPLGTVIAAEHARVGQGTADVGTTVYGEDYLNTDQSSVQVRAGAARLPLQSVSSVIVNQDDGVPSAKLLSGTTTFPTANAHAFTLFASTAAIRPSTDEPTIGQVRYVSEKELVVTARRGGFAISVEDQTQTIAPGTSYRVLLDPPADAQPLPDPGDGADCCGNRRCHLRSDAKPGPAVAAVSFQFPVRKATNT